MRRVALAVLTGCTALISVNAHAGGCGYSGHGYVTPCWPAAPAVTVYPAPVAAAVACETEDLVNQGQFYSTEPLIVRRACFVRCPPPPAIVTPMRVIPACWR